MKPFVMLAFCFSLILFSSCRTESVDSAPASLVASYTGQVVVIDPGHGGVDHGAVSRTGAMEDQLNLQVSLLLADKLEQHGATVVMTRKSADLDYNGDKETRKQRDMENRARLVAASNPDAVISIHMNKHPNRKFFGPQTFFLQTSAEGKKLASDIQDQLLACLPSSKKYRIVEGNYFMLHVADAPSVIVECGFLSNPHDDRRLKDSAWQEKISASIFKGVCDYFGVRYD